MKVNDYYVRWKYEEKSKEEDLHIAEVTTCIILDNTGEVLCTGAAFRNREDGPNKNTGRKISLTRALEAFTDKKERSKFWEKYRTMTKQVRWKYS
jgi:hypothetical protein